MAESLMVESVREVVRGWLLVELEYSLRNQVRITYNSVATSTAATPSLQQHVNITCPTEPDMFIYPC